MRSCLLALLVLSCTRPAPAPPAPWPVFPADDAARDALVKERTLREPGPPTDFSAEHVFAVAEQLGWSTLPAGEKRVYGWIAAKQPKWLLVGTFHDSAGQVEAFRHLVGPGGVEGFTHVALEQLEADGRWRDFAGTQRGDSAALSAWLDAGTRETWGALARSHRKHDYTAWKYGYERAVLDVVASARHPLPCDAPHTRDERLRELHCLFSVRESLAPDSRVAMLWGHDHVTSQGFRRFLPPAEPVLSVYAIGARWSADAPDSLLREKLLLDDLVLVPLGENEAALMLPDGHVDRVRSDEVAPTQIRASASSPGTLRIGAAEARLSAADETVIALPPGEYTYAFHADSGLRIVGALELRGDIELAFDASSRATRIWLNEPLSR